MTCSRSRLAIVASEVIFTAGTLLAARIDVYPQSFDAGGWKLDVQFMDVIGSPYLLAHGCGIRVTDAKAVANVPESGRWHMWVRSRKWVDGAGVFKVSIDGRTLGQTFGVSQTKWDWEDGGEIELKKGLIQIVLEDKDGFDGRCAGVVLTNDGIKPDGALKLDSAVVSETIDADFVVRYTSSDLSR